jgi:hypothetical protein
MIYKTKVDIKESEVHVRLGKVSANTLGTITFRFLLCFFEDKFCDIAIDVVFGEGAGHRTAHRSPDQARDD